MSKLLLNENGSRKYIGREGYLSQQLEVKFQRSLIGIDMCWPLESERSIGEIWS